MAAAADKAMPCRLRDSGRRKLRKIPGTPCGWIAGRPQPGLRSSPNRIRFTPEEARNLKVEGEVLLEVMFSANGQLHVSRVVRGLGHGLDEAAIAAANKMRFKPATHNGQAVDSTAIVHVVFQLAY